jgi:serine/threonine-protein kinase
LFETPPEQLRDPDDPTGGVTRPGAAPIVVVPATPDEPDPVDQRSPVGHGGDELHVLGVSELDELPDDEPYGDVTGGAQLVILPVDSELDGGPGATLPEPAPIPDDGGVVATAPAPTRELNETAVMPVAVAPAVVGAAVAPPRRRRGFPWKIVLAVLVAAALVVLGVLASQLFETPEYTVPDLVGVPEAEARNVIAPYDWELSVERERSDLVPVIGQVIRTAPGAGVDLAEGEPFLLVVSEGPVLRELPELIGLTLADAQNELVGRDLDVSVTEEFDEEIPPGVVIAWSVPGDATLTTGSLVLPETVVELVVSRGPEPRTVPNVVALAGTAARAQIEELGLVFDEERQEFSDEVPAGFVISQAPEAGSEVQRGDTVWVVISRGPDLVTFPDLAGATTYEDAAVVLTEAGFVPILTFGDAQGDIISMTIDGEEPVTSTTYRRGTEVEISALSP